MKLIYDVKANETQDVNKYKNLPITFKNIAIGLIEKAERVDNEHIQIHGLLWEMFVDLKVENMFVVEGLSNYTDEQLLTAEEIDLNSLKYEIAPLSVKLNLK